MRHGEAEMYGTDDFNRHLTDDGCETVKSAARRIREHRITVDKLVSSPLVRARETAQLVSEVLGAKEAELCPAVTPDTTASDAVQGLSVVLESAQVAIVVMHQPIISRLILYLTGVEQPMGTADIALLDVPVLEQGCCELVCTL